MKPDIAQYFPVVHYKKWNCGAKTLELDSEIGNKFHVTSSTALESILYSGGKLYSPEKIRQTGKVLLSGNAVHEGRSDYSKYVSTTVSWSKTQDFLDGFVFSYERAKKLFKMFEDCHFSVDSKDFFDLYFNRCAELGYHIMPSERVLDTMNMVGLYRDMMADEYYKRLFDEKSDISLGEYFGKLKGKSSLLQYACLSRLVMNNLRQQIALYESLPDARRNAVDNAFPVVFGFGHDLNACFIENDDMEATYDGDLDLGEKLSFLYYKEGKENRGVVDDFLKRLEPQHKVKVYTIEEVNQAIKEYREQERLPEFLRVFCVPSEDAA